MLLTRRAACRRLLAVVAVIFLLFLGYLFLDSSEESPQPVPEVMNCHSSTVDSYEDVPKSCLWKIKEYLPSEWEKYWYDKVHSPPFNVCEELSLPGQVEKSVSFIQRSLELSEEDRGTFEHNPASDDLFSRQVFSYHCPGESKHGSLMETMIEPLIGNTRDPLTICPKLRTVPKDLYNFNAAEGDVQSKRHILVGPSTPIRYKGPDSNEWTRWSFDPPKGYNTPWNLVGPRKMQLLDIGAGLFSGRSVGDSESGSGSWFLKKFSKPHGPNFSRIWALEIEKQSPEKVWKQVPPELVHAFAFINMGATEEGKYRPWTILETAVQKDDYTIVKLDVDSPALETALIHQLKKSAILSSLIDELAFVHHADSFEMRPLWGKNISATLADTYSIFLALRKSGIRTHAWT